MLLLIDYMARNLIGQMKLNPQLNPSLRLTIRTRSTSTLVNRQTRNLCRIFSQETSVSTE